ncbi:unnamed protein product, partial [Gulo gulo]
PSLRNWSRCAGLRSEVPSYPHLTTLLHSGSTRPEVEHQSLSQSCSLSQDVSVQRNQQVRWTQCHIHVRMGGKTSL